MGFEDREYFQDQSGNLSWGSDTPTTKRLLIFTVAIFFLQTLVTRPIADPVLIMKFSSNKVSYIDEWFMLDAAATLQGQIWRIVTYPFCHDRQYPFGLVFDMLLLWFLGRRLERMYGSQEFLLYYLGASTLAGIVFLTIGATTPLLVPLSGAAPAVMALFTLYAIHFPREELIVFWLVPVQIFVLLLIYIGVDTYTVLRAMQSEIGWPVAVHSAAHLSGAGFAWMYRHFNWHLSGLWNGASNMRMAWRRATNSRRLRVYQPSEEPNAFEEKLDAILAKIHEHGSESLSDSERAFLEKASQRKRNQ